MQDLPNPLVESFVAAAEKNDPLTFPKLVSHALVEGSTSWRSHDQMTAADRIDSAQHRFREHHHSRAAAVRLVVSGSMLVGRELAKIPHAHIDQSLLHAAGDDALGEQRIEHPRKDRDE